MTIGNAPLAAAAVGASAALAAKEEQYGRVATVAVSLLHHSDEVTLSYLCARLASISKSLVNLPVELLVAHNSEWLRALASLVWAERPDRDPEIGHRLARDRSRQVRGALAGAVRKNDPDLDAVREILANDPRRSVREHLAL